MPIVNFAHRTTCFSCEMSKAACIHDKPPQEGRGKGGKGKGKGKGRGKQQGSADCSVYETYSFAESQWKKQLEAQLTASIAENKRLKAAATSPGACDAGTESTAADERPLEEELQDLEAFVKNNKEAAKSSVFSKIASDAAEEKAGRIREKLKAAKPAESLHRAVLGKIQKAKQKRERHAERLLVLRQGLAATQKDIGELLALQAANELEIAGLEAEFTITAAATVPKVQPVQPAVLSESELASKPELRLFQESQAFKEWQQAMQTAQEASAAAQREQELSARAKQNEANKATEKGGGTAGNDDGFDDLDPDTMDTLFKLSGNRKAFDEYITEQGMGKKARKQL